MSKKLVIKEINNGYLTGEKIVTEQENFKFLDLKKVAKKYISGGIEIYIEKETFQKIKKDLKKI